jgi:hypothetical protein
MAMKASSSSSRFSVGLSSEDLLTHKNQFGMILEYLQQNNCFRFHFFIMVRFLVHAFLVFLFFSSMHLKPKKLTKVQTNPPATKGCRHSTLKTPDFVGLRKPFRNAYSRNIEKSLFARIMQPATTEPNTGKSYLETHLRGLIPIKNSAVGNTAPIEQASISEIN